MVIETAQLIGMLHAEMEMAAAWADMNQKERRAYLLAHPRSKYATDGGKFVPSSKNGGDLQGHLMRRGFKKTGGVWKHKNGSTIQFKNSDTHKHHIIITHKNGSVHTHKTNTHAAGYITHTSNLGTDNGRKVAKKPAPKAPVKAAPAKVAPKPSKTPQPKPAAKPAPKATPVAEKPKQAAPKIAPKGKPAPAQKWDNAKPASKAAPAKKKSRVADEW